MSETQRRVMEYLASHGPSNPWRIARDLGIPESDVVAVVTTWEPRSSLDGPGQNYVRSVD